MTSAVRIVVDATAGARPERSGVGRYVHGLLGALAKLEEAPPFALGVRGSKWRDRGKPAKAPTGGAHG